MGNRLISQLSRLTLPQGSARTRFAALVAASVVASHSLFAGSLNLTWTDNSDNEEGFEIERSRMDGDFALLASVAPDATSYVDQGVMPGIEYQYRVRAFNTFGYSGYTNVSQGSVENTPPSLGEVGDVVVLRGEASRTIAVSVSDAESSVDGLTFEAMSSDLSVVPLESIALSVQDDTVVLQIGTTGAAGTSSVTLLASDGVAIAQRAFSFEVQRNLAPTISSVQQLSVYDAQKVGPVAITISDTETDVESLEVTGVSLNGDLVASESVRIEGSGASRQVFFQTAADVSGTGTVRIGVSDGVNTTYGAIPYAITINRAPEVSGFEADYTLASGGKLTGVPFTISDKETSAGNLTISVESSNHALVAPQAIRVRGTGAARTLDVTPAPGQSGSAEITVSVSDGARATQATFTLSVLPPESVVDILSFTVEESLAVIEVANRSGATFTLWKIHGRDGAWAPVGDVEVIADAESTVLIDPTPITGSVCYRVVADR